MNVTASTVDAIGRTPLIRLRRASEMTGCEILGKAEFMNPGGSVKDRAALYIVKDAEERGLLRPGGVIVEGTAGNTGIGLALVANARGYRTVIVIPETQSEEKKQALRCVKRISNANIFEALISRDQAHTTLVDQLLSLFDGHTKPVMARLVESGRLTMDDIREAEDALKKMAKKGKPR